MPEVVIREPPADMAQIEARRRVGVTLQGRVQGMGFRPFVRRLAARHGLDGAVRNAPEGVALEIEGPAPEVEAFLSALIREAPDGAEVAHVQTEERLPRGRSGFRIEASAAGAEPRADVLPDRAMCPACRQEILDPRARRYGFSFTTCTACGPRWSVVEALPYDRERTTYRAFRPCDACEAEYASAEDRRFHAQTVACPQCGPHLVAWGRGLQSASHGAPIPRGRKEKTAAIAATADVLARGGTAAVKGLGGYQLVCDARAEEAVRRLRLHKRRDAKPFAVMVRDIETARRLVRLTPESEAVLQSAEAPVFLAPRAGSGGTAPSVAPGNARLGVFLPTTPLHQLLLEAHGGPLVVTSGNVSDEPMVTDDAVARTRFASADLLVEHDRAIARPVDDGVVQWNDGGPQRLRCGRGSAPLAIAARRRLPPVVALGGYLKGAVAFTLEDRVVLGQHLGELESPATRENWRRALRDVLAIWGLRPEALAADPHPAYPHLDALPRALREVTRVEFVLHHHAHVAACLLEHGALDAAPALGVSWDGTGYGDDDTVWGGEFLACSGPAAQRVGRLRPFVLPGGDRAAREPWRSALGIAFTAWGEEGLAHPVLRDARPELGEDARLLGAALRTGTACVRTSSAGRLFDAAACIAGFGPSCTFEAQAALGFEDAVDPGDHGAYRFPVRFRGGLREIDWEPALRALVEDRASGVPRGALAARFHRGLAEAAAELALATGIERVALTGGAFANRTLTEGVAARLRARGRTVLVHRRIPPGDGGLAAGQAAVAALRLAASR